jgi:hypothetical protein
MDAAEQELLRATVAAAIEGAGATPSPQYVDDALGELGWREMLSAEPRDAIEIVFGALGETNAPATVLDDVLASALGVEPSADLAVLLPPYGGWDAPGDFDGDQMSATGLVSARVATADRVLVVCAMDAGLSLLIVPRSAVEVAQVHGIDPDGRLSTVRVAVASTDAEPLERATWESAVASGRRALARQLAGADRAMLELARAHAVERVQFGRPIAGFQAVRHRLAEALVAVEALDASVGAAWDEPNAETAALSKAVAGRTTRTVTAHCQQVLAGVGFTTEHSFHRYLKRTIALEGLLGSADRIVVDLGRALLRNRKVPTVIDL